MGLAVFQIMKWQVPWDLPLLERLGGKSHGTCHFPNDKMASPMGLATPITTQFSLCRDGLKMASPIGLAIFKVSVFGW